MPTALGLAVLLASCGLGKGGGGDATTDTGGATTAAAVAATVTPTESWIDATQLERPPPNAPPPPSTVPQGGRLRAVMSGDLNSWEGLAYSEVALMVDAITCNTLVGYPTTTDPELNLRMRAELAASMPAISDDGLRYTFRIRSGIRYSDGRELVPQDVKGTFLRMFDPAAALPTVGLPPFFDAIAGVPEYTAGEAEDIAGITVHGRDVTFALTRRDGGLLYALASGWACIVPADAPRQRTNEPPPMTGPYVVTEHVPNASARLDRNPYWYDNVAAGLPADPDTNNVDGFDILIGVPPAEAAETVTSGRADVVLSTDTVTCCLGDEAPRLAADPAMRATLTSNPGKALRFAAFDVHAEPFDDPRVRRAVNLAIDRRAVIRALGGRTLAVPSSGLLPAPILPSDAPGDPYPDTPRRDEARRLLREAGVRTPVDAGKLYYADVPILDTIARRIVVDAHAIGVELHPAPLPYETIQSVIADPDRHDDALSLAGYTLDLPDGAAFLSVNLTSAAADTGDNHGGFSDPAFDAALDRIESLVPGAERQRELARLSHDVAAEHAPWLSLYTSTHVNLLSSRYGGYAVDVGRSILLGLAYVRA